LSAGSPKAIRILFVEDEFDQALLVKAILQSHGNYAVTHSQDGDHAAKLLDREAWDLLITDLNLPGLDGFDLCRLAKAAHPDLPVLAVTGYTGAHYQEQAFRAGASDLLTKPLDPTEFVRKVNELTGATHVEDRSTVLAVGGLVGDVEMGCGGALLKHRLANADVVIVPLSRDDLDPTSIGLEGARRAAEILGAKIILDEVALDDTQRRVALLERVVRDLRPKFVYIPAMDDAHPARREAFRIGQGAAAPVPSLYGYQTATTGPGFNPAHFEDIGEVIMDKMEALAAFQEAGVRRPDLSPRMAQAYARYWGRLHRFTEVEPFEVLRTED
jgi:CheY-like chemotaxis protein